MALVIECVEGGDERAVAGAIAEHRQAVAGGGAQLIQSRSWRPVSKVACGSVAAAVKEYRHGASRRLLGWAGFRARARQSLTAYRLLDERGFRPAPLLAIAEERVLLGTASSYLVSRWI